MSAATPHRVEITEHQAVYGPTYVATCSCGWTRQHAARAVAEASAAKHQRTMTEKFTWRRIVEIDADLLLTGFDDDGIVIGFTDDDQGDDPVAVLRWNADDIEALLADLRGFVNDGKDYTGGYDPRVPPARRFGRQHSRIWALTRTGDDLVLLTDVSAEVVAAVRIPVDAVPGLIAALRHAQDDRDQLVMHDAMIADADPDDFK